ncbi:MAG: hypothetical protein RIS35_2494 [Pseudomonadota bacterium]
MRQGHVFLTLPGGEPTEAAFPGQVPCPEFIRVVAAPVVRSVSAPMDDPGTGRPTAPRARILSFPNPQL